MTDIEFIAQRITNLDIFTNSAVQTARLVLVNNDEKISKSMMPHAEHYIAKVIELAKSLESDLNDKKKMLENDEVLA